MIKCWTIIMSELEIRAINGNEAKHLLDASDKLMESLYPAESLNGDRLIGFHVNRGYDKAADFYDSTRFYEKLYRPDIVRLAFQLGSEEAAIAEASKKRRTEKVEVATILPPKVRIVSPANGAQINRSEATLELEVSLPEGADRGTELKLIVKVNGRNLESGQRGIKKTEADPASGVVRRFSRVVPLGSGRECHRGACQKPKCDLKPCRDQA